MVEHWYRERIDEGWEIRDIAHDLVAVIPDEHHEKPARASLIAASPILLDRRTRLRAAIQGQRARFSLEAKKLRGRCRVLSEKIARDAAELVSLMAGSPPERVSCDALASRVTELQEVQRRIVALQTQLEFLRSVIKDADPRHAAARGRQSTRAGGW